MNLTRQNITFNPPAAIELKAGTATTTLTIFNGVWRRNGQLLSQQTAPSLFIDGTNFTSKLVISNSTYGDSGVYTFMDDRPEVDRGVVTFYVSLPSRDIASESQQAAANELHIDYTPMLTYVAYTIGVV